MERAAFLLHDVFGLGFDEVAASVGREEAACRQLAARARAHVRQARPRYAVDKQHGLELAQAFFAASRSGDAKALSAMLAQDVAVYADGGGKRPAAMKPILGRERVLKNQLTLARNFHAQGSEFVRAVHIDGLPGFVSREADGELQTMALEIVEGRIAAIYVVRNPDKLKHLH